MKILIHGRKNGYSILHPKPTPPEFYSFASDIQSISANNYDVYYGKYFYTLAFVDTGCIFTKYVLGDDVERGQLGEIGISVFIPNTHKLSGTDVKTLLDGLISTYCRNYISDNKIDEPKNGFDWLLFTSLANQYDIKLQPCSSFDENVTTGTQAPAFHYYKSDGELIELLDKPFQEEYSDYKQILLIDSNLQGDANPLNILKNSGIEVNPDLKNDYFYLNNYIHSKGVKIKAYHNNEWIERSDVRRYNCIRAKQRVEIFYSKDDRCYEQIKVEGTISDINSGIHKYLGINNNQIKIKYDEFDNPKEKKQEVTFEITDKNGKGIEGAEIQIDTQPCTTVSGSKFTMPFYGGLIIKNCTVLAKKGDNYISQKVPFCPVSQDTAVKIIMQEFKNIEVIATIEHKKINDFTIQIPEYNINSQNNILKFWNENIDKKCTIIVRKSEGINNYSDSTEFCPRDVIKTINVNLSKNESSGDSDKNKKYYLKIDENKGKRSFKRQPILDFVHELPLFRCDPLFGYKFVEWKRINEKNDEFDGYYEAIFKEYWFHKNPKTVMLIGIGVGILSLLFICAFVWWFWFCKGNNEVQSEGASTISQEITDYIIGDDLLLDKLDTYKASWKKQEHNYIAKSGGNVWGGNKNSDSTKWKNNWQPKSDSIEEAISKRTLINNKDFEELLKQNYSTQQRPFMLSLKKIQPFDYEEVGIQLGDVSEFSFSQIASSIDEILENIQDNPKEPKYIVSYLITTNNFEMATIDKFFETDGLSLNLNNSLKIIRKFRSNKNHNEFKTNAQNDSFLKQNPNLNSWIEDARSIIYDSGSNIAISSSTTDTPPQFEEGNKTTEVEQNLKSASITRQELAQYKEANFSKLNNSIALFLDFWDKVDNSKKMDDFTDMLRRVNNDNILKNSELKKFLHSICSSSNDFNKFLDIRGRQTCSSINNLKDKLK